MWTVKYKPNNGSQKWYTLNNYYSSVSAITRASWASGEYFIVIVTNPGGSVIWSS